MRPINEPLEHMGFYTMTDFRCSTTSSTSRLGRCVLVLTENCNFACPYCRSHSGVQMATTRAKDVIRLWAKDKLFTLVFTGGEPTLHPDLVDLIEFAKDLGIPRVGLSTNGAASMTLYRKLCEKGVDDFSISLDADNAEDGAALSGRGPDAWQRVVDNIREIAALTRVTIGLVFNETNTSRASDIVRFALSLGVADVRLNPAAQFSSHLPAMKLERELLRGHPILAWRLGNQIHGIGVRGLSETDPDRCWLALDEMTVSWEYHYPCFVYMREGGKPIGPVGADVREQRKRWSERHNPKEDAICSKNCPDCLVAFNRRFEFLRADASGSKATTASKGGRS
jgi:pyruvate-formate lyase-activating enzyme